VKGGKHSGRKITGLQQGGATRFTKQVDEFKKYVTWTGSGDAAVTRDEKQGYEYRKLKIPEEMKNNTDVRLKEGECHRGYFYCHS
jgi:hypothetical protein